MSVKQVSIFLENKPGSMVELSDTLAKANVDLRALTLPEAGDYGIARIIVDDVYKAATALKDSGFVYSLSEVIVLAMEDRPGMLHEAVKLLSENNVNVEHAYSFLGSHRGVAYMIFKVSDIATAERVLRKAGMRLADQDEISEL